MQDHPASAHPDLLVGMATADDAGVYALGDGRALVQTVDIFTPIVDSPTDWGRIAAANALSDIYAMGAKPITALQYLAWPRDELSFDIAAEVVGGGMDAMAEASCTVVGGHSVDGPEPLYGFAVTGIADTGRVVSNAGGRPGDVLILTKPIGMGIISTAIKRGKCPPELAAEAVEVMSTLNEAAGEALHFHRARAATDVTGYGLLGHLREMCRASGVGAEVVFDQVPVLEGVARLLALGMWAGGSQRNLESLQPELETTRSVEEVKLLVDAQTSGGLLVALGEEDAAGYVGAVPRAVRVGRLTSDTTLRVV